MSEKPNIPEGVGPHTFKELDLMLEGKKHLAYFSDIIPENGQIDEAIIPEKGFAQHVTSGEILRFERKINGHNNRPVKQVCFTTPDNAWRAHAVFWLLDRKMDDADDIVMGRLLGYTESEIQNYITHKNR